MNKKTVIGSVLERVEKRWIALGRRYPDDIEKAEVALKKDILAFCEKKECHFFHRHRVSVISDAGFLSNKVEMEAARTREEFVRVVTTGFLAGVYRETPTRTTLDILEAMLPEMFSVVAEVKMKNVPRGTVLTVIK